MAELKYIKLYEHIKNDKNLDCAERLIYNLIYNFTEDGKACFLSNKYIADDLCIEITKVKRTINKLIDKKYIIITKYKKNRTKRLINRYDAKIVKRAIGGCFEGASFYLIYKV